MRLEWTRLLAGKKREGRGKKGNTTRNRRFTLEQWVTAGTVKHPRALAR